jgi:hypothetical protein
MMDWLVRSFVPSFVSLELPRAFRTPRHVSEKLNCPRRHCGRHGFAVVGL